MNIAILGATSFLAKRFANDLMERGHELMLYARKPEEVANSLGNVKWRSLNILNFDTGRLFDEIKDFDVIINCLGAGVQSSREDDLDSIWLVNAFMPIRLIEQLAAHKYEGVLFTFGSYFEIGELNQNRLLSEEEFVANQAPLPNAYCLSKKTLTSYVGVRHLSGMSYPHLHCILTNIYGVGESPERLIPYIFRQAYTGKPMRFSSGVQQRQYTHIDDIAAWVGEIIEKKVFPGGIFNVTDDAIFSVKEVIEKALAFLSSKGIQINDVTFDEITKRDTSMSFLGLSSKKARMELNWKPLKSLDMGIAEYYERAR